MLGYKGLKLFLHSPFFLINKPVGSFSPYQLPMKYLTLKKSEFFSKLITCIDISVVLGSILLNRELFD